MGKAPLDYIEEAVQTKSDQFYGEMVPLSYVQALAAGIINRINELDKVKKALFYGKPIEGFDGVNFAGASCERLPAGMHHDIAIGVDLVHGIIGKVTEAGEQLEAMVKTLESPFEYLDLTNLVEEIGDGQWYDAIICAAIGVKFEQVQQVNIDKLRARFPHKFTEHDANNRNLDAERAILSEGLINSTSIPDDQASDLAKRLYATTDASVWAAEFMAVAAKLAGGADEVPGWVDEGWMISWFANAIETAKSHERANVEAEFKAQQANVES